MIDGERYQSLRNNQRELVTDLLQQQNLSHALRGSWKYNDFHFDAVGKFSLSDLDLVVEGLSPDERRQLQKALQRKFLDKLSLRVSVHGADSLLKMNLTDSFILNTGEFISKARNLKRGAPEYDYTLAKIVLLLLRDSPEERYHEITMRVGTLEAHLALKVKLGLAAAFPVESAAQLLRTGTSPTAHEFADECVLSAPSQDFANALRLRIRGCDTIAPWLQEYLIAKMDGSLI